MAEGAMAGRSVVARAGVKIDALDFLAKSKVFSAMPGEIRSRVLSMSFRAVSRSMEAQVVKSVAAGTNMRAKDVRKTLRTSHGAEGVDLVCVSKWTRLTDLGSARQTKRGVWVRGWGAHRHAFLIASRKGWAYKRTSKKRLPIVALWGPNPAQYINGHAGDFARVLVTETERRLLPEVERLLGVVLARL